MANPATYDIKYYKGDSYALLIFPKTSLGTPFNLSEFTGTFDISDQRGTDASRWKTVGSVTVDPIENSLLCEISPTVGSNFDVTKTYYYDISVISGPAVHTFVTGTITTTDYVVGS
jgi:hypothetical protein